MDPLIFMGAPSVGGRRHATYMMHVIFEIERVDTGSKPFEVLLRAIGPYHGRERLLWRRADDDALHPRHAFTAGTVGGLGEHRLARREMGVEAAVRQPGVLHDVGDAGAVVAAAPDGTRGGIDDAIVRSFLGSSGG